MSHFCLYPFTGESGKCYISTTYPLSSWDTRRIFPAFSGRRTIGYQRDRFSEGVEITGMRVSIKYREKKSYI